MILAPLAVTVLLLCGCAASLAALPAGSVSLPLRVASVFALGYATVALTAVVLVLVHAMTTVVLAPVLVVVVVGMAAVAVRRSPVRATAAGLRAEVGADRLPLAAGAVVIAAIAVARMVVPVDAGAGGWRYWADGLEIAHAGHVPNVTLQWGILQAPAISKLGANSYNAALALALQSHPFSAMAASLWLSSIGFAVGLWALAWELGLRRISPVVPLVATAVYAWPFHIRLDGAIVGKLQFFQNEDAARMCAVIAVALALTAIRGETHGRLRPLVAGIIMAAAALTHLVPVLAMLALLVGYAVASIVRTRSAAIPARAAGTVLGTALLIPVVALAFAGGDLGFQGATGHSYQTLAGGFDPTLALLGRLEPPRPKADAHFYTQPGTIALNYVRSATALTGSHRSIAGLILAVAALAAIAAVAGGTGERLTVAAATCMAGLLLAATMLFSFRYSYYIPATFGDRRLFEYGSIPLLLLGAAAGNALLNLLHGRALAAATVCVPVLAAVAVGWTGMAGGLHRGHPWQPFIQAARLKTSCDSRLLTPFMSRGSFQALSGRTSIREGLMVFLRPDLLARALLVERQAREFYKDPVAHAGLLDSEHLDYVLAYRRSGPLLDRVPGLERSGAVANVLVYRVVDPASGGGAYPSKVDGYPCTTEPMK